MSNGRRGPWYLITGVLMGLLLGFGYARVVQPVQVSETSPASLMDTFKDQYRMQIARAYAATGDFSRAQARLTLLGDVDPQRALEAQAQRALAEGASMEDVRALGSLASIASTAPLGVPTAAPLTEFPTLTALPTETLTPTPTVTLVDTLTPFPTDTATPRPTETISITTVLTGTDTTPDATPTRTPTLRPSVTPTPTPGQPYVLKTRRTLCIADTPTPLIIVRAQNAAGSGVPGVEIIINWENNEERFFTGLKPELGLGYADFAMQEGVNYQLRLADAGQLLTNLSTAPCTAETGTRAQQSIEVIFEQP